ncbi:MAG: Ig-like domain-containing protein [Oscillospiraceae bacterium]|nr:Ig-like domain-containing protein [Oscillospiraceae bacterium]
MKRAGQKKILSFVLVAVMLTSLFGFYVQAEDSGEDQSELIAGTAGHDTEQPGTETPEDGEELLDSEEPSGSEGPSDGEELLDGEEPSGGEELLDGEDPSGGEEPSGGDERTDGNESLDGEELSYREISCSASKEAFIVISGILPYGAYVTAVPVIVDIDDETVLAAYDITIHYADGFEFQPDEDNPVEVSISSPEIERAVNDEETDISVYHMAYESAPPEEVPLASAVSDEVSFTAESFSIYVITGSSGTFGSGGFIEGSSIVKVGASIDLRSNNNNYTETRNHAWSSSNNSIATVSGTDSTSTVTGASAGEVTITHTFQRKSGMGGWRDSYDWKTITVVAPSLEVTRGTASGRTVQLIATPSNFTGTPAIVWSVTSGGTNASVDAATGLVTWADTAPRNASVTVRATATSGTDSASDDIALTNTKYTVTYNDGVSGTQLSNVPEDSGSYYSGAAVTVLGPGSMTRRNYTFAGWRNSSGTYYYTGDAFTITGDTTLSAVWISNSTTFDHVDVEISGTLTIEYQENGTVTNVKHYNLTVSSPQVKVDGGSWDSTPNSTSSTEFRFLNMYSTLQSKIYIKCNVTAVNSDDASDTFTKELSLTYDGATPAGAEAIFRANALCPAHTGLDFVISESEIENTLLYSYQVKYAYYTSTDGGTPAHNWTVTVSTIGPVAVAPTSSYILENAAGTSEYNENSYTKGSDETDVTFDEENLTFTVKYYRSYTTPVIVTHSVSYTWSGSYPSDAVLPDSASHEQGDPVTIAPAPTTSLSYWTFNGWKIDGATASDFEMGQTDVTIVGSWTNNYVPPITPPIYNIAYTVTYAPGDHGTFDTQTYQRASGTATPTFSGTPTGESGWTFTGWSPTVDPTVTGSKTYTAQWSTETPPTEIPESPVPLEPAPSPDPGSEIIIPDGEVPGAAAPVTPPSVTPQTGDSSSLPLLALLAVLSAAGLGAVGVITRKKKRDK